MEKIDVLEGILDNYVFVAVIGCTVFFQIIIIEYLGAFANTTPLTFGQWFFSVFIGFLGMPVAAGLKMIPVDTWFGNATFLNFMHRKALLFLDSLQQCLFWGVGCFWIGRMRGYSLRLQNRKIQIEIGNLLPFQLFIFQIPTFLVEFFANSGGHKQFGPKHSLLILKHFWASFLINSGGWSRDLI